ncbi:MAG TPA: hypothetical protein VLC92_18490 [Rhodocyclaceae bacterium]|nr:hypothetical protein [Rhodocyclaceae bacterium]
MRTTRVPVDELSHMEEAPFAEFFEAPGGVVQMHAVERMCALARALSLRRGMHGRIDRLAYEAALHGRFDRISKFGNSPMKIFFRAIDL